MIIETHSILKKLTGIEPGSDTSKYATQVLGCARGLTFAGENSFFTVASCKCISNPMEAAHLPKDILNSFH